MKKQESDLQKTCVSWFRLAHREEVLFAIPNGGSRDIREAARLKAEGVLAGIHDLFLMKGNTRYHGLWIEMKFGKGKESENQKIFREKALKAGYQVAVCYSLTEFMNAVNDYMKIP